MRTVGRTRSYLHLGTPLVTSAAAPVVLSLLAGLAAAAALV